MNDATAAIDRARPAMDEPVKHAVMLRLYPNETQAHQLRQWIGVCRALWNHLLWRQKQTYEAEKRFLNRKELEAARQAWEKEEGFAWRQAPISHCRQRIVIELDNAFRTFFDSKKGKRKGARVGFPRFKKRLPSGAVYFANTRFKIDGQKVKLDKIGEMRFRSGREVTGRILGARVRHTAGHWWLAVQVEAPAVPRVYDAPSLPVLGVDVGLKAAVARSDGIVTPAPQFFRKAEKKLRRLQRRLSAAQRGSRRREMKQRKVARLQERIRHKRQDFLHVRSARIVGKAGLIALEDLNVKGMARGRLAKSVADAGMGELARMITYKAEWSGRQVVKIGRYEPSSKTCSACGQIHEMPLHRRMMRCDCGLEKDRDLNAAMNIARWGTETVGAVGAEPGQVAPTDVEMGVQVSPARPVAPVPVVEASSAPGSRPQRTRGRGSDISLCATGKLKRAARLSPGPGP
jgi:putative transposase